MRKVAFEPDGFCATRRLGKNGAKNFPKNLCFNQRYSKKSFFSEWENQSL